MSRSNAGGSVSAGRSNFVCTNPQVACNNDGQMVSLVSRQQCLLSPHPDACPRNHAEFRDSRIDRFHDPCILRPIVVA